MAASGRARAYGRYGWMILCASALLSLLGAVFVAFPLEASVEPETAFVVRSWGVTWAGFDVLALAVILGPYRRGERWAWYALWLLPLLWFSYFVLAPDVLYNLLFALLTALGLILPYRMFFSGPEGSPERSPHAR